MPSIFCPKCKNKDSIVSAGEKWKCKKCGRLFLKNPKMKQKGWRVWNKGLTKKDPRVMKAIQTKNKLLREGKIKNPIENLPEPKIEIFPDEMKILYKKLGSQRKVAERLGVCQSAIFLFMKRHNIKANPQYIWINRDPKKQAQINKKISKALKGNTNWRYSHTFPNSDELTLIQFFARNRLPFEYVGDGRFLIDGKSPDFVWREKKLIVEFFGDIWHRSSDEPSRIKFFEKRGWRCLVVWGREIRKSGWEGELLKKILEFIS